MFLLKNFEKLEMSTPSVGSNNKGHTDNKNHSPVDPDLHNLFSGVPVGKNKFQDAIFIKFQDNFRTFSG
jgi:hypothetical protein